MRPTLATAEQGQSVECARERVQQLEGDLRRLADEGACAADRMPLQFALNKARRERDRLEGRRPWPRGARTTG